MHPGPLAGSDAPAARHPLKPGVRLLPAKSGAGPMPS